MGKVAITYKVMPEDAETDLEAILEEIKNSISVEDIGIEPVAFGLKAVKVSVLLPDKEGVADETQGKIEEIDGVQSVEVEFMDLL